MSKASKILESLSPRITIKESDIIKGKLSSTSGYYGVCICGDNVELTRKYSSWNDALDKAEYMKERENFSCRCDAMTGPELVEKFPDLFEIFSPIKEDNSTNIISFDIPTFIRILEITREDIKSDNELHEFVEQLQTLTPDNSFIDMKSLETIINPQ